MDIYIFSDESGVFDSVHNDIFVFGGIVFLSKEDKDDCARKYIHAERTIRETEMYSREVELKADTMKNKEKGKLFRSLSQYQRFGLIIHQKSLLDRIFKSKKDKQRYLDYAYKIGLKRLFEQMIRDGTVQPDEVKNIHVFVDEHTTATNGKYELREALEQEFRNGTYNYNYSNYFPPIFSNLKNVTLDFCNSAKKPLIRAADVIANKVYYLACKKPGDLQTCGVYIHKLPEKPLFNTRKIKPAGR